MSDDEPEIIVGRSAFEDFYRTEYRRVLALATVLTGERCSAEDIVQDAFLTAHQRWNEIDHPAAWMRTVVTRRATSRYRRIMTEIRKLPTLAQRGEESDFDVAVRLDIWAELRKLPPRQAVALSLTYLEDLPRVEVASIMGCGSETVKTHVERGRKRLAEQLSEHQEVSK